VSELIPEVHRLWPKRSRIGRSLLGPVDPRNSIFLSRSLPSPGKGKSGGYRVLYAFLPVHGTVLLIAAWPKSEREDLERDDYKAIGKIIARIQTDLDRGRNL
jgi:mRNA-degrading endonuclease RelE of RelBE toxin-antitoxin system